ncbi:LexA family transcriptional regulator [Janthinobacterium sp. PSPC3-1]|uniref:LexA family transcriptional regulator n=1 Tax=Janthinobacterium sp. PSPC3-1 TaxID=2804653 RepID=UPI003CEA3238
MNTLATRLAEVMAELKITKSKDFAVFCGVSDGLVTQWFSGQTKLGPKPLKALARTRFSLDWIVEGKLPKYRQQMPEGLPNANDRNQEDNSDIIEIPQYRDIGGGMGNGVMLRDQPGAIQGWRVTPEWVAKNIKSHSGSGNLCIVTGFGNSMQPLYNPGDPLIIDRGINSVDSDATYFFRVGDEGFIKILQRIPGEGIRVISKNKDYETWTIKPGMDFEVFGQVLKAWCGTDV